MPSALAVDALPPNVPAAAPGGNAFGQSRGEMRRRSASHRRAPSASVEPVAAPRADQRHDVVALRRHPGDRDLRRRGADLGGNGAQPLRQRQIGVEVAGPGSAASSGENPCAPARSFDQWPLISPRASTP